MRNEYFEMEFDDVPPKPIVIGTPKPFYRAVNYPGVAVTLSAILDDGREEMLDIGSLWTICDCRRYVHGNGYTQETIRHEDGLAIFEWRKP